VNKFRNAALLPQTLITFNSRRRRWRGSRDYSASPQRVIYAHCVDTGVWIIIGVALALVVTFAILSHNEHPPPDDRRPLH
jgi:hypothetical protein